MSIKQVHILYTVLDWGLGHATRSIPIIQQLIDKGTKVSIAGEGDSIFLLKAQFPQNDFYPITGIKIKYPSGGSMVLKMALTLPENLLAIYSEHKQIKKLIEKIKPDAVISDSRFGAWSKSIPSIFITHQINIKVPKNYQWLEPMIFRMNKFFLTKFTKVWIPDFPDSKNLTGDLAHTNKTLFAIKHQFIGPISRLENCSISEDNLRYELFILLSGPEPQRSIFEKKCIDQSLKLNLKTIIVCGKPQEKLNYTNNNLTVVSHLSIAEIKSLIYNSKYIVCRSGYSTLMDLSCMKKPALCIATPGQTEQEYLAHYLSEQNYIATQEQSNFNLQSGIEKLLHCRTMPASDHTLMKEEIDGFLVGLRNTN